MIQLSLDLLKTFPAIKGNADYQILKNQLERMDEILKISQVANILYYHLLKEHQAKLPKNTIIPLKKSTELMNDANTILRCILARNLLVMSYRDFAARLADSFLLQKFCLTDQALSSILRIPSKSTLHGWENDIPESIVKEMNWILMEAASVKNESEENQNLLLKFPISFQKLFVDTTCLEAAIHYPVDWMLIRDAVRTLILSIIQIRKYKLFNRMDKPREFITIINKLCIAMSQSKRKNNKEDGKKETKKIIRNMIKLLKTVRYHAEKHRELLVQNWQNSDIGEQKKDQILGQIDNILLQISPVIELVQNRILKDEKIPNDEKIFSLYDQDIQMMVRKKAGKAVEFGNALALGEQENGIVVTWKLYKGIVPSDAKNVLADLLKPFQLNFPVKIPIENVITDRGFDGPTNRDLLESLQILNQMCPRKISDLQEKLKDSSFAENQKRRAGTEARISIVKNVFYDDPGRAKGFDNRERRVAWSILTHNLWVIARLERAMEKIPLKKAA